MPIRLKYNRHRERTNNIMWMITKSFVLVIALLQDNPDLPQHPQKQQIFIFTF